MRTPFTGCGTALVTPFKGDGALDEDGVRRLARRQIEAGIHFLVPCGTTGESPTLSEDERIRVVQLVVEEAAGRVPDGIMHVRRHLAGETRPFLRARGLLRRPRELRGETDG